MPFKTTVAAIVMALLPSLATAQGCRQNTPDQTASSCIEGTVWDKDKGTCVTQPSS